MKKVKREIVISQTEVNPIPTIIKAKRLLDTSDCPVSTKIGALLLADEICEELKCHIKNLEDQITDTDFADLEKALVAEGVLNPGETPVFVTINKVGKKEYKELVSKTTHSLNMDAFKDVVKDPKTYAALPEEYKVPGIQSKTFFTSLYKAGKIPALYSSYFALEEKTTTGFKTIKGGSDDEK